MSVLNKISTLNKINYKNKSFENSFISYTSYLLHFPIAISSKIRPSPKKSVKLKFKKSF